MNRNGHRLRKLKQRLTKRAIEARNEKMKKGGTWRQDMVVQLDQTFGAIATVMNKNQDKNDWRYKMAVIAFALQTLTMLGILGRVMGWW